MTKSELIRKLAAQYPQLPRADIQQVVDLVFEEISEALAQNRRVEIRGFGAFSLRTRNPRQARNPRTSEVVRIEERCSPYFRAGKELKEKINL